MKKLGLFALSLFYLILSLQGQIYNSATAASGFVIPHHDDMYHLYRHQYSMAVQSSKFIKDKKNQLGYHVRIANLGSPTLGWSIATGVDFDQRLFTAKKWALSTAFTAGIGWLSNPYNRTENPQNRAIGTALNGFVLVSLKSRVLLTENYYLGSEIQMSHFSNGAWRAPNLGVNLPAFGLSLGRIIPSEKKVSNKMVLSRLAPYISYRVGRKSVDIDDQRSFIHHTLEGGINYRLSNSSVLRSSLTLQYDPFYRFEKFQPLSTFSLSNSLEIGFSVGYMAYWGNWTPFVDVGFYLYKPKAGYKTPYFEGLGLGYQLNKNWQPIVRLKANKTTADIMEWGVIYTLN